MSEVTSSFSKINNAASPYTTREETQRDQSRRVANRWARFLRKKDRQTDMMALSPVAVHPSRQFLVRNAIKSWAQMLWARHTSKVQRQELKHDIAESRRNMQTYVRLAQFAINLAVRTEPDREIGLAKKRILWEKWRTMYQRRSNF